MSVCCLHGVDTDSYSVWRLWSPCHTYMLSTCLALNKTHYSVLPRHLHYSILMSRYSCHVWFGLGFGLGLGLGFEHLNLCLAGQGLGLGLEHLSPGLSIGLASQGLGLELLSLESKPADCINHKFWYFQIIDLNGFDWSHHRILPTTTNQYGREPNGQHGH